MIQCALPPSLGNAIVPEYDINIRNNTGLFKSAAIILQHYEKDQIIPTIDEQVLGIKYILLKRQDTSNVETTARTIDGVTGVAASDDLVYLGASIKQYSALYYPVFDSKRLSCLILSEYPWDEGSLQLLKTIHIEKINKAVK